MSEYPVANRQKDASKSLYESRELAISAAERIGVDLVGKRAELAEAKKKARVVALVDGVKTETAQKAFAELATIREEAAVGLASTTLWAAKARVDLLQDYGHDLRSRAKTLQGEMDIAKQGGQP